jgi:hypothetical protein
MKKSELIQLIENTVRKVLLERPNEKVLKNGNKITNYTFNQLKDIVDLSNPPRPYENEPEAKEAEKILTDMGFYNKNGGIPKFSKAILLNKTKDGKNLQDLSNWFDKNRT